jgi:hypothetical protein
MPEAVVADKVGHRHCHGRQRRPARLTSVSAIISLLFLLKKKRNSQHLRNARNFARKSLARKPGMEENERDGSLPSSPSSGEDAERMSTSPTSFEMVALEEMNNRNRKNRDKDERNRTGNETADDGSEQEKPASSHTALRRKRSGSGKGVGQSGGEDLQTSAQQGLRDDSAKTWVMRTLFRTAENERGPSRTRAKASHYPFI